MYLKIEIITFLFLLLLFSSCIQNTKDEIFVSDIENFWRAYDSVQTTTDILKQTDIVQTEYIDKGTAGLNAFMELRNFDAKRLVKTIRDYPRFWASIRPRTLLVKEKMPFIDQNIQKFKKLYPDYRKAQIFFTITAIRSGGTVKDSLVLIGTEIAVGNVSTDVSEFPDKRLETFFKTQERDNIVPFTIHEYVHTQQKIESEILLGQSIYEGACDFITELILDKKLEHSYIQYGRKHEEELKKQFKKEMFSKDFSNWLYNGSKTEIVGDLGYFMGYAICKAYYKNAKDKKQAIKHIIELDYSNKAEVVEFVRCSKYYQQ